MENQRQLRAKRRSRPDMESETGITKQIKIDSGQPKSQKHSTPKDTVLTDTTPGPQQSPQSDASRIITDIFEALIDPSSSVNHATINCPSKKKAHCSKHQRDGLRKTCSITEREILHSDIKVEHEIEVKTRKHKREGLTPTVEADYSGFDYIDCVDGLEQEHDELNRGAEFTQADPAEQNRRVTEVATCLQLIGDQIMTCRESRQSSSEPEGGTHGSDQSALFEYFSKIGVDLNSQMFSYLKPVILPVIRNIIVAKTYDQFQNVIRKELQNTVGWEQVAWYTYLTRSAMLVVENAIQVGPQLKQMATQYFTEHIRRFIEQQPNGWQSMPEETDGELN